MHGEHEDDGDVGFCNAEVLLCATISGVTNNPAQILHVTLQEVREHPGDARASWSHYLQSSDSADLARRHAELVGVYRDCCLLVDLLEEGRRARYVRYLGDWYAAVSTAAAGMKARQIISDEHLDLLQAFAEDAGDVTAGTVYEGSLNASALQRLRDQLTDFLDFAEGLPNGSLSITLIEAIRRDSDHLIWLIDSVEWFGPTRVMRQAHSFGVTAYLASGEIKDQGERRRWRRKVGEVMVVVAAIGGVAEVSGNALEQVEYVLHEANDSLDELGDLIDGPDLPKAVESGRDPGVVEGEGVDDESLPR